MACVGWSRALALVKAWLWSLLYFNIAVNSLLHVNSQEISDRGKLLASGVCMCEQLSMAIHARMFPICQGLANHV